MKENKFKRGVAGELLDYMLKGNHITSMQAFELFGCTRLSSYIYFYKKSGYNVKSKLLLGRNRYKESTVYSEYWIEPKEEA